MLSGLGRQLPWRKSVEDLESTVASNAKAIADLKIEPGQSIVDKFRLAEDRPVNIAGDTQGLNKTVVVLERRRTETAEKTQELTVRTSNIQVQVNAQDQKMIKQSANDMNETKTQPKDVDAGHQTLVQKVPAMEIDMAGLSALRSTNDRTLGAAADNLERRVHDAEQKLDQSSESEIQSVCQHLELQMQTNNPNTEKRLAEADAGSQQPMEKLLEVEKDVEGKDQTISDADNEKSASKINWEEVGEGAVHLASFAFQDKYHNESNFNALTIISFSSRPISSHRPQTTAGSARCWPRPMETMHTKCWSRPRPWPWPPGPGAPTLAIWSILAIWSPSTTGLSYLRVGATTTPPCLPGKEQFPPT